MNKTELVAAAAEQTGMTKKDTEKALNAAFDVIASALGKVPPPSRPARP